MLLRVLGVSTLALGVLGMLLLAIDVAFAEVRSWRREVELNERLSDKARWR